MAEKTAKAVTMSGQPQHTPLKRGVNEITVIADEIYRLKYPVKGQSRESFHEPLRGWLIYGVASRRKSM
jgi:hypothetical protein